MKLSPFEQRKLKKPTKGIKQLKEDIDDVRKEHLEEGVPLANIAKERGIRIESLERYLSRKDVHKRPTQERPTKYPEVYAKRADIAKQYENGASKASLSRGYLVPYSYITKCINDHIEEVVINSDS